MKLTPYRKLLTMTKEAIDLTLAGVRAHSAKKKAELEMAKLDERLATLQAEIDELCSKKDINFDSVIDKLDDAALAERRRGQFEKILRELFPEGGGD